MKKFITLLLAGAMAASLAVAANAADLKALKGTPTVDGKLDDIYKQAGSIVTNAGVSKVWAAGTGEANSDSKATTYALWDDKYIYFATEVKESTVVDTGINSNWKADAVELWINYNNTKDKVSVDAFGTKVYGNAASVPQADCKFGATNDKTGYVVELAIPIASYKAGDSIGISIQINDFLDAAATNGAAWGSQKVGDTITLSAEAVKLPEAPKASAATADPAALALLAAAASAAGIVVSKKKH